MSCNIEEVVNDYGIIKTVREALISHTGKNGRYLFSITIAFEHLSDYSQTNKRNGLQSQRTVSRSLLRLGRRSFRDQTAPFNPLLVSKTASFRYPITSMALHLM
jgi:hypothetical protein